MNPKRPCYTGNSDNLNCTTGFITCANASILVKTLLVLIGLVCQYPSLYAQGQLWGTTRKGGSTGGGVILKTNADASDYYEVKKEWVLSTAGTYPQATLAQTSTGRIYGVAPSGGLSGDGVLFEYSAEAGYQVWWNFNEGYEGKNPQGGLVEAGNGKLYGLTTSGGPMHNGTLFEFDHPNNLNRPMVHLTAATGTSPRASMLAASNGKLYGTCLFGGSAGYGVLFEYDPFANVYTVKHNFDNTKGAGPWGALIQASNGKLYGTTFQGGANALGVLFEYDVSSATFVKLHDFTLSTGASPTGALVQASNGKLYGTCPEGGANSGGVIFEYDIASSQYTLKQSFIPGDLMGRRPFGGLTEASNGKLYGLTKRIAINGVYVSVIIEFDPASGATAWKLGASFSKGAGEYNYSSMIRSGNSLYGVSPQGGETGSGVLFSYNPLTDDYQNLVDFDYGEDGALPYAGMTLAGNGKMYGMVSAGGAGKKGLLYEFDVVTNGYVKKVEFTGSNGANPLGELLLASNGKLYGTTSFGGASSTTGYFSIEDESFNVREGTGFGVLFEYDPATGTYIKKAEFDASTGKNPYGQLMEASDGKLYGVTNSGGVNNGGTIYRFDITTSQLTKLKDLPANANFVVPGPRSGLTAASNGKFYGVTPYGDNSTTGGGIVYEYNPMNGDLTILKKFPKVYAAAPNEGNVPIGKLTAGADGKLYGMNSQGGQDSFAGGSIFQVDPATGQVTTKKILTGLIGVFPQGGFVSDASGKMYALCNKAGAQRGTIIQYDPVTNAVNRKVEFSAPLADEPDYSSFVLYPGKMDQRIALAAFTPKVYGTGTITLPANSSAGLPVTYTSSNPAVATVSGNVITLVSAGSTDIKATRAGTDLYNAAPDVTKTLTVTKADQTITFDALTSRKITEKTLNLFASASSHLEPIFTSSDPDIASVDGYVLNLHKVGTVNITVNQPGNDAYNAAEPVERQLVLVKGDQTITFGPLQERKATDPPFALNATSSAALPISYTSSNPAVATVSSGIVTITGGGTTTITASQAGDEYYFAAPDISVGMKVTKVNQTITFAQLNSRVMGSAPFDIAAAASSALAVQLTSASDKISIEGNTVTLLAAGSVTIRASQPGNSIYNEAPPVEQTFCINPEKPAITVVEETPDHAVLSSSSPAGNQWYYNTNAIAGAGQQTYTAERSGSYIVRVKVDNCLSEFSDPQAFVITGTEEPTPYGDILLYPNPAKNKLIVQFPADAGEKQLSIIDANGRELITKTSSGNHIELETSLCNTGLYLLRIHWQGKLYTKKFAKE